MRQDESLGEAGPQKQQPAAVRQLKREADRADNIGVPAGPEEAAAGTQGTRTNSRQAEAGAGQCAGRVRYRVQGHQGPL